MVRRSVRLQEAGYYTEEGRPCISYKEVLYKVFRRRRNHVSRAHQNFPERDDNHQESVVRHVSTTGAGGKGIVCGLLMLLLLAFGNTCMYMRYREVEQELLSFRQRMGMFAPLSDTTANFALESLGAKVLPWLSSDTYLFREPTGIWDQLYFWLYSCSHQRHVIQGRSSLHPGQCWPFPGVQGKLCVLLSHTVSITHVTLGHITKGQSPNGNTASAPREFSVYGLRTMNEGGTYLGTLTYDQDGAPFQTFQLPIQDAGAFSFVRLHIENNWGNKEYTCLYSFRVHGKLPA